MNPFLVAILVVLALVAVYYLSIIARDMADVERVSYVDDSGRAYGRDVQPITTAPAPPLEYMVVGYAKLGSAQTDKLMWSMNTDPWQGYGSSPMQRATAVVVRNPGNPEMPTKLVQIMAKRQLDQYGTRWVITLEAKINTGIAGEMAALVVPRPPIDY